jgi:hypothetical protein
MHLEDITASLMEPGDQDNLLTRADSFQAAHDGWSHFQPSLGGALTPLFGSITPAFERRMDETDRP